MVLVMVVVLGQITLIHGATKIPYSWCCCWTVGLIVLTRGGDAEADQESQPHFFFSSCDACSGKEIYEWLSFRRGRGFYYKGVLENLTS